MLSLIGIEIYGITSDAGGNNSRLFNLLRNGKRLGHVHWVDNGSVSFRHPCSDHQVAMWFCSVHNFKNCRNAVLNSTGNNKKRKFECIESHIWMGDYDRMF
jgi:hypothetical protein